MSTVLGARSAPCPRLLPTASRLAQRSLWQRHFSASAVGARARALTARVVSGWMRRCAWAQRKAQGMVYSEAPAAPQDTWAQGCSNHESRESGGTKNRWFTPNSEALNKIPNRLLIFNDNSSAVGTYILGTDIPFAEEMGSNPALNTNFFWTRED